MRLGNLKRSVGQDSKVGCVLDIPFRYVEAAHQGYFMSRDVYGHRCQNFGSVWNLDGRKFDGIDDYVDCGNDESLVVVDQFFVEFLERLNGTQAGIWQAVIDKRDPALGYVGYAFQHHPIVDFRMRFHNASVGEDLWVSDKWIPVLGTWYCYVVTYNGTTYQFYVNGEADNSCDRDSPSTTTISLWIGRGHHDNAEWLNACINRVRIYNRDEYSAKMLQRAIRARRN